MAGSLGIEQEAKALPLPTHLVLTSNFLVVN